jgi:tRNA and rRNA cytosine-C5-methylases
MRRNPLSTFRDISSPCPFKICSSCRSSRSRGAADRADILDGVLHKHRTLDDQLDGAGAHPGLKSLADRDRALMRRLVATILRRLGSLGHVLSRLLDRGIPTDAPRAQSALLIGAAQILWMDVPDHAAVDLSVRLVQSDRRAAKYAGLVNAVLRRARARASR